MCNVPASRKATTKSGGPQLTASHFPVTGSSAQYPFKSASKKMNSPAIAPLGTAQNTFQIVGKPFAPHPNFTFAAIHPKRCPIAYTTNPHTTENFRVHASGCRQIV